MMAKRGGHNAATHCTDRGFKAQTERMVNTYLVNPIAALRAQLELASDVTWLRQHDPPRWPTCTTCSTRRSVG
jgi:hypothetical protein